MEKQEYLKMHYVAKMKWINQQLKDGKELEDILDLKEKSHQTKVAPKIKITLPVSGQGLLSTRVNSEVLRQWKNFAVTKNEKEEDLFSMALWQFMKAHI